MARKKDYQNFDSSGRSKPEPRRSCPQCRGDRTVSETQEKGTNAKGQPAYEIVDVTCPSCKGSGLQ